ncbi:bifunctional autolysin [Edaphobacillus lindanitolerans]|uniref:Bifunctional autolysin n=1 Tax=Edaphobacillus lindanitolerans TaxID=550447 RepID=A0A1U7PM77_9BACI|nr:bifunctional autolysin [Edaphobacillus lindanitolerans]
MVLLMMSTVLPSTALASTETDQQDVYEKADADGLTEKIPSIQESEPTDGPDVDRSSDTSGSGEEVKDPEESPDYAGPEEAIDNLPSGDKTKEVPLSGSDEEAVTEEKEIPEATNEAPPVKNARSLTSTTLASDSGVEANTSRLGHLNSASVRIHRNYTNPDQFITAGTDYTNEVYYIKRQATYKSTLYYLISRNPSSTTGVVGWVKASDMSTQTHVGVDKNAKTFYILGSGHAYSKAWGGKRNISFNNLSGIAGQEFKVNLTEKVGNNIWYRGVIEGKTAWIIASGLSAAPVPVKTSRLGHLNSVDVRIYKDYLKPSSYITAGTAYTHEVYYIKQQIVSGSTLYYLISRNPSSTTGVVGWVRASDMSTQPHFGIDKEAKRFYIKGTGNAYDKAWGGRRNISYEDLSRIKGNAFDVNLTEQVGNVIWYRGVIEGRTAWIRESDLTTAHEEKTSLLGHLRSANVQILSDYENPKEVITAGTAYTNEVYYIKKQAVYKNVTYYLISRNPSSTTGVVGWVKAADMSTHPHAGVDKNAKTFYIKGTGHAYDKAWGGKKNISYENLSRIQGQQFKVNLTEKVGETIWYRGVIDGKTAWISQAGLSSGIEEKTSRLGHLRTANVLIYPDYAVPGKSFPAGTAYTHEVYYIKLQTTYNNVLYYLISRSPSSTKDVVGWVKASDLSSHPHKGVDKLAKTLYINGTGMSYTKAWGGKRNLVLDSMASHKGKPFNVNLTEKVGENLWYRGVFEGNTMWLQQSQLSEAPVSGEQFKYTNYNKTLAEALDIQMKQLQQTDKYRNQNAYVSAKSVEVTGEIISTGNVNLRSAPNLSSGSIKYSVPNRTSFVIVEEVTGDVTSGSNKWYKIIYNNETLYVHSSLSNPVRVRVTASNTKVMAAPDSSSHLFGTLTLNSTRNIVTMGKDWHEIKYDTWRNPTREDVAIYLDPDQNSHWQHLDLSAVVDISDSQLNQFLTGKGILAGKGKAFNDGARSSSINVFYLMSHAFLETGNGTSKLATGSIKVGVLGTNKWAVFMPDGAYTAQWTPTGSKWTITKTPSLTEKDVTNLKPIYNMFGIEAVDSNPDIRGALRAYQENWYTPEAALQGGAKFVGERYIHNSYKQNTLYKMRWNPANPGYPQYATDIEWAIKQVAQIKRFYDQLENPLIIFDIPKYK